MKSDIIKKVAAERDIPIIEIKLSESEMSDFLGLAAYDFYDETLPEDQFMVAQGVRTPMVPDPNPIQMLHTQHDPWTGATMILEIQRRINVGDMVLMEYARGVVETVVVEEITDGIVYATGDDGEPYSAPLANCDKVPC